MSPERSPDPAEGPDPEEHLYALPLSGFVQARNALARQLRSDGRREAADGVRALKKPSVTAWAVNQLYHHYPEVWNALMDATDQVRQAHTHGPSDLARAVEARKEALTGAVRAAEGVLTRAGGAAGPTRTRRITGTLEALTAGVAAGEAGRLTADLEPPGFGGLQGLALAPGPTPRAPGTPAGPKPGRRKPAAASRKKGTKTDPNAGAPPTPTEDHRRTLAARRKAQAALVAAREQATDATARALEARQAVERARDQVDTARDAAGRARDDYERARARKAEAEAALRGLERRLEKSRTDLAALEQARDQALQAEAKARDALERLDG